MTILDGPLHSNLKLSIDVRSFAWLDVDPGALPKLGTMLSDLYKIQSIVWIKVVKLIICVHAARLANVVGDCSYMRLVSFTFSFERLQVLQSNQSLRARGHKSQ